MHRLQVRIAATRNAFFPRAAAPNRSEAFALATNRCSESSDEFCRRRRSKWRSSGAAHFALVATPKSRPRRISIRCRKERFHLRQRKEPPRSEERRVGKEG